MIELNKKYSTRKLAEALEIGYSTLRNNRKNYEEHLSLFYFYQKEDEQGTSYYTFTEQLDDYISYKEFKRNQKDQKIQECIKTVIKKDERQTASNIARIIYADPQAPKEVENLKLSTLKIYVRTQLKSLVASGYYSKFDYAWCYLDKVNNRYILMSPEEVLELRAHFKATEEEENIWVRQKEGELSEEEAIKLVGSLRKKTFIDGLKAFQEKTGFWAMKVPLYVKNRFKNFVW